MAGIIVVVALFAGGTDQIFADSDDAGIILNRLLGIKNKAYTYKDQHGVIQHDELMEYKGWSALYGKYAADLSRRKSASLDQIRYLLMIGFVAKSRNDAAMSEAFSSDLVPIYTHNRDGILAVMRESPFLIPSTCYYMNNYFGFEDKNANKKPGFLADNEKIIVKVLGQEKGGKCLRQFGRID